MNNLVLSSTVSNAHNFLVLDTINGAVINHVLEIYSDPSNSYITFDSFMALAQQLTTKDVKEVLDQAALEDNGISYKEQRIPARALTLLVKMLRTNEPEWAGHEMMDAAVEAAIVWTEANDTTMTRNQFEALRKAGHNFSRELGRKTKARRHLTAADADPFAK